MAASGVFSAGALAAPADMPQADMPQDGDGRYVRPVKFGLGGVPFGNEFEVVSDEDAYKTLEAAWNAGVRYWPAESSFARSLRAEGKAQFGPVLRGRRGPTALSAGAARPPCNLQKAENVGSQFLSLRQKIA